MKKMKYDYLKNWHYNIEVGLDLLKAYINENEKSILKMINDYKTEKNQITNLGNEYDIYANIYYEYLNIDSLTYSLDDIFKEVFPNWKRTSILILQCNIIEKELKNLCVLLEKKLKTQIKLKDIYKSSTIKKILFYLSVVCDLLFDDETNKMWDDLIFIFKLRNEIVHNNGLFVTNDKSLVSFCEKKEFKLNDNEIIVSEKNLLFVTTLFFGLTKKIQKNINLRYYD